MTADPARRHAPAVEGALHGLRAWAIFGAVEALFASLLAWLLSGGTFWPLHTGFTALLLLGYMAGGALVVGAAGLALRLVVARRPGAVVEPVHLRTAANLSIVLLFLLHLARSLDIGLQVLLVASAGAAIIAAHATSLVSPASRERLRFVTSPWTASLIVVGVPFWTYDRFGSSGALAKAGLAALHMVVVLGAAGVAGLLFSRNPARDRPIRAMPALLLAAALALLVLGVSPLLRESPLETPYDPARAIQAAGRPNVILVVLDTVRADHLSLHGYERRTTPNLERLAERATVFTRAVAPGDMSLSSHGSLFTGQYASQHGAHYDPEVPTGRPLPAAARTLAEVLAEKGYRTMAVAANHAYLARSFGFTQGFQFYDDRVPVTFLGETPAYLFRASVRRALSWFLPPHLFELKYRKAGEITDEAIELIEGSRRRPEPFFLFVNYMDAHQPGFPPPPFDTMFPGREEGFTQFRFAALERAVMRLRREATPAERAHLVSQYDGAIAYLDDRLGHLMDRLKQAGLYEKTLVVITSDHGEVFGDRGLIGHAVSVYQDQIHVPLIIKYPGSSRRETRTELVSLIDVMPTVLDALTIEAPEGLAGRSLREPAEDAGRHLVSESFMHHRLAEWHPRFQRNERAILTGSLKLITSTAGKRELYDLAVDPRERTNLYGDRPSEAATLEANLDLWVKTAVAQVHEPTKLDKATLDRLRSLGYIK